MQRELHDGGLAAHIRDPENAPAPPGIEPRRLRIYTELFFNNIEGMLANAFPVIRSTLGDPRWRALVRDFIREHPSHTPLFAELPRELLRYLEGRSGQARQDPPWLPELAHYEWVELALQISDAQPPPADPDGDLLDGPPALSPLAWPLAYAWPVHRIGPDFQPDGAPTEPTLLLVRRTAAGEVSFVALSPLAFRLLQRLEEAPELSGRHQLQALAGEAGAHDVEAFVAEGARMLSSLRADGTLVGTRIGA